MVKRIISTLAIVTSLVCHAQTQSDKKVSEGDYGMVKTNINVQYDHCWGNISDGFGTRVAYQAYKNKWLTLSANGKYNSVTVDFDEGDLSNDYSPSDIGINGIHVIGQLGFTTTMRTKVLGKPFVGIAMANSDWSTDGFERLSGTIMGIIMLRASRKTQFGIGPLVLINTSSKLPAFIVFMYRHRFNEKLLLNLYGGMFGLDYNPNKNSLISIGSDINVKSFYFNPSNSNLPKKCRFTLTSFRPMVKYRHLLSQNLYFDMYAGTTLKMSCRVNGKTGTKEYLECKQKAAPFLQAGISYSL